MKAYELRGKRQNAGIRLEKVAASVGIHGNTLADVERGRVGIDMETYQGINEAIERLAGEAAKREEVTAS